MPFPGELLLIAEPGNPLILGGRLRSHIPLHHRPDGTWQGMIRRPSLKVLKGSTISQVDGEPSAQFPHVQSVGAIP
eukprot:2918210-Prorocentrum_lima.AAC.1